MTMIGTVKPTGGMAPYKYIKHHKRARLAGVVDVIMEKAVQFAEQYGADGWHTDYRHYLGREEVDIVMIATYPSTHLEIAKAFLALSRLSGQN